MFDDTYSYTMDEEEDELMMQDQRELIDAYFDTYEEEEEGSISQPSRNRRNRKKDELMKQVDKGFVVLNPNTPQAIAYFLTDSNPGSTIRNAVSGIYETGNKFGSKNEDLYFKVSHPSSNGVHFLFYDSPEQFEKHFRVTVGVVSKVQWSEKSTRRRRELQESRPSSTLTTIVK